MAGLSNWLDRREDSTRPIYDQIKVAIRQQILSGHLAPGQRLPAMRDLCNELGVSYATVARSVRDLVKEGILESSTTEGTRIASRRRPRLHTIGIVGSDPYQRLIERSRYYQRLLHLLLDKVAARGRTVLYRHWQVDTELRTIFEDMSLADSLIVLGPDQHRLHEVLTVQRLGVPVICVGKTFGISVPTIDSANTSDAFRAVQKLINDGHRRIACIGEEGLTSTEPGSMRAEGHERALAQAGLSRDPSLLIAARPRAQAEALLRLKPTPTAAFFAGGVAHLADFFSALEGTRLRPGQNLAMCIYDEDLWQTVQTRGIPFYRVEQPLEAIATQCVELIARMLDEHNFSPGHIELPSRLVRVHGLQISEVIAG